MEKAHVQYQDLLKETRAATLPTTLKVTSSSDGFKVMDRFDKANLHLRQWREILRKPRFPTCTIDLMVKAFPKLKDGKTVRFSSLKQTMMH